MYTFINLKVRMQKQIIEKFHLELFDLQKWHELYVTMFGPPN